MYQKLLKNVHAGIDTGNQEWAVRAYGEANDAWRAHLITHEEFAEIRGDFQEAFPDLL